MIELFANTADPAISPLAQYGLAGVVITALFTMFQWAFRTGFAKFEAMGTKFETVGNQQAALLRELADENREERTEIAAAHRAERDEWRKQAASQHAETLTLVREIETTIRNIGDKTD